jgi:D-cysteine desulfhydrase
VTGAKGAEPLSFGRYPTPVERLDALSTPDCDLWVKRDDLTNPEYGGNKVRKLERILADALARGARRVVTVGAAGSHHVFATAHFGRKVGLEVEAVLVPQPRTEHVLEMLRAGVAAGLRVFPVRSWTAAAFVVATRMRPGTVFVPVGGSSVAGTRGYVDAARELAAQVRAGAVPEPDVCVVALGSGGTAAGLALGLEAEGLATRVVGVCVATPRWAVRAASLRLAKGARARLSMDARFLGGGYGYPTSDGDRATREAMEAGLSLDPTYTAKAFACALWHVRARRGAHILYWHTLSSAPMAPLLGLDHGPSAPKLSPRLLRLTS